MARVPLIGRLFWVEYLALFGSLILVLLEWIIHIITYCLRKFIPTTCWVYPVEIANLSSGPGDSLLLQLVQTYLQ